MQEIIVLLSLLSNELNVVCTRVVARTNSNLECVSVSTGKLVTEVKKTSLSDGGQMPPRAPPWLRHCREIVLQMQVFTLSNCRIVLHVMTVLLEYSLTALLEYLNLL